MGILKGNGASSPITAATHGTGTNSAVGGDYVAPSDNLGGDLAGSTPANPSLATAGQSTYYASALGGVVADTGATQVGNIETAIAKMPANGGRLMLPCGNITIDRTLEIVAQNVILASGGQSCAKIISSFTTGDVLKISGVFSGIEDLTFAQQVPSGGAATTAYRASGYTLNLNGPYQSARHVSFLNCFICVRMGNPGGGYQTLDQVEMRYITPDATATGSGGISVQNTTPGPDNFIDRVLIAGSTSLNPSTGNIAPPTFGIQIANSGGTFISHVDVLGMMTDLLINPGQEQNVAATFVSDAFFDSAQGDNVVLQPSGSGFIFTTHFTNVWLTNTTFPGSSATNTNGLRLVGSASTHTPYAVMDTSFTGGFIVSTATNPGTGVLCNDNRVSDTKITATTIAGWTIGANIGCSDGTIADNSIGAYSPFPQNSSTNANGVILNNGVDYVMVHNNRMRGNTNPPIADYSTGTHTVIRDNESYTPPPAAALSLSGSPATLSAGHTPADFYVFGGAVQSIVAFNGNVALTNMSPALIHAEPNESYQLNYTSAPTVTKVGH